MEPKNSIGGNLGSTLTAIKTKGSKALHATARFLRWTVKPVVSIYSYFVSKSKSDAAQSREEDTKLGLRNITVSDESNNTIDKKTTSHAEPRSTDVKASTTSNSTLMRQKSQEHLLEAKDEVPASIRPHKIRKQEYKPEESVDGTIDLKTAVTKLLKKTAHADHDESWSQREVELEELRAEIKKHPPNSEPRRHAEYAYHNAAQFHKDEVVDYLEKSLRNVIRELLNRFPQISLEDARGVLTDHYQLIMLLPEGFLFDGYVTHAAFRWLEIHFQRTRQTGLMLALTQFQEGAVVSVFEKRSTEYNRVQVVRLDPKWMEMLKFYLGEHFYDMFGQDGQPGKGTIRSDGFGEIAIHRLEEGLNHRLTELMARNYEHSSQSSNRYRGRIERLAAYEMTDVKDSKGGVTVQAKYNPQYDPSPFANGKIAPPDDYQQPEKVVSRSVDLVICAGGKNSQIRNQYMKDRVVTDARNYGVCSWEGTKDQPIANGKLDTFPDFRGVVTFDQEFQKFFREQLKFQVDKIEGLSSEERKILYDKPARSQGISSIWRYQPLEEQCRPAVLKIRIWSISGWSYLNHLINSAKTLKTL